MVKFKQEMNVVETKDITQLAKVVVTILWVLVIHAVLAILTVAQVQWDAVVLHYMIQHHKYVVKDKQEQVINVVKTKDITQEVILDAVLVYYMIQQLKYAVKETL